jgi:hypothetical protein
MREDARVHKGSHLTSGPRGVTAEVARQWAFAECSKGCVYICMPPLLLIYHVLNIAGYGNRIQNGSHECRGPAKPQGSKV